MNPKERAKLCSACKLKRCNESSRNCLVRIRGFQREVKMDVVHGRTIEESIAQRARNRVVTRCIVELLAFGRMTEGSMEALVAPYRKD